MFYNRLFDCLRISQRECDREGGKQQQEKERELTSYSSVYNGHDIVLANVVSYLIVVGKTMQIS